MNNVNLIGRVTRDIELHNGQNSTVCKFSLAVNRRFKKDETDFINCVAFGKTAETISQYVSKGQQFAVSGRLQTGSYDRDGQKVYTTDVIVESFTYIASGTNHGGGNEGFTEPVDNGDMPL